MMSLHKDVDISHLDLSKPNTWTDAERLQVSKNIGKLIESTVDCCDEEGRWLPDSKLDAMGQEIKRKALSISGCTNEEYDRLVADGLLCKECHSSTVDVPGEVCEVCEDCEDCEEERGEK